MSFFKIVKDIINCPKIYVFYYILRRFLTANESHKAAFLITISDKKAQQEVIDVIKANLDVYKEQLERILRSI